MHGIFSGFGGRRWKIQLIKRQQQHNKNKFTVKTRQEAAAMSYRIVINVPVMVAPIKQSAQDIDIRVLVWIVPLHEIWACCVKGINSLLNITFCFCARWTFCGCFFFLCFVFCFLFMKMQSNEKVNRWKNRSLRLAFASLSLNIRSIFAQCSRLAILSRWEHEPAQSDFNANEYPDTVHVAKIMWPASAQPNTYSPIQWKDVQLYARTNTTFISLSRTKCSHFLKIECYTTKSAMRQTKERTNETTK